MDDDPVYYSNVQDILDDSGIQPVDIGFKGTDDLTPEKQLEAKIVKWLVSAKSYVDSTSNRDFHDELQNGIIAAIPVCIHDIARRATINMVNSAKLNRKSPVIKVNDYSVKPVTDNPMTSDILADLERCISVINEDPGEKVAFNISSII